MYKIIITYMIIVNIISFFLMFADKKKAKKKQWRISEKTLFLLALLGGSVGSILGMYLCRHKTKHWYFVVGMPVIFFCQLAIIIFLFDL